MPDDGLRCELLDGTLLEAWHRECGIRKWRLNWRSGSAPLVPPELHVVIAPFEWRGSRRTAPQPDVLVAWRNDLLVEGGKFLAAPSVLAVEALSPSTRRIDRLSMLSAYEKAGVASYWLVDPGDLVVGLLRSP